MKSRIRMGAASALLVVMLFGCLGGDPPARQGPAPAPSPAAPTAYTEDREQCSHRDPLRRAFFGELHIHTRLSMDANLVGVRGSPDDAYRFARGEAIGLPPYDVNGKATRRARLGRPLDFAAVTDHASFLGPVSLCTRSDSAVYDTQRCRIYRGEIPVESDMGSFGARLAALAGGDVTRAEFSPEICGSDGSMCRKEVETLWQKLQESAEHWYDRSAECRFTTFHAYEYTATPELSKVHRNVIFRNANVIELPISYIDQPSAYGLWRDLETQCLEAGMGCDVLAIPHNSNLSNGRMFSVDYRDLPIEEQRIRATLRDELEPLVEIMQIKGDSECRNGLYDVMGAADELCDFEKWRPADTEDCREGTGVGALSDRGCISRLDFVRYALIEGLRERDRIGVNPYKLGIIAATDTHNANPGDTEEHAYQGWAGASDDTLAKRLAGGLTASLPGSRANPGGLAGVWAEENSRDALFDAMRRRETFGTSGPRMTARFFGGWDYADDLCAREDLVRQGYEAGVPMGSDLPLRPAGAGAPQFVVSALRDPGVPQHPGGLLQRIQIIKGWYDAEGHFQQAVHDVAGGENGADVDPDTCTPRGPGADALCSVWTDPAFDPQDSAVYYARVLENPSCRWNQRQCLALPETERPAGCADEAIPRIVNERLWSSPIWYDAGTPAELGS